MNLEEVVLSGRIQILKTMYCMIPLISNVHNPQIRRQKAYWQVPRAGALGERGVTASGDRFPFRHDYGWFKKLSLCLSTISKFFLQWICITLCLMNYFKHSEKYRKWYMYICMSTIQLCQIFFWKLIWERNIDLLSYLFMHSLVYSWMCPDRRSNLQPWCTGKTP